MPNAPQLATGQLAAGQLNPDQHLTAAIAAAAPVKLVPYDAENPSIWFRLIDAQFTAEQITVRGILHKISVSPNKLI